MSLCRTENAIKQSTLPKQCPNKIWTFFTLYNKYKVEVSKYTKQTSKGTFPEPQKVKVQIQKDYVECPLKYDIVVHFCMELFVCKFGLSQIL